MFSQPVSNTVRDLFLQSSFPEKHCIPMGNGSDVPHGISETPIKVLKSGENMSIGNIVLKALFEINEL